MVPAQWEGSRQSLHLLPGTSSLVSLPRGAPGNPRASSLLHTTATTGPLGSAWDEGWGKKVGAPLAPGEAREEL